MQHRVKSFLIIKHILHIVIGAFYPQVFTWTIHGLLVCLLVSSVVQGLDSIRWYFGYKKWFLEREKIPEFKGVLEGSQLPLNSLMMFLYSSAWYGLVTMIAAMAAR